MQRSIATTYPPAGQEAAGRNDVVGRLRTILERSDPAYIGLFFIIVALGIYIFSDPARSGWYNHFVWQSDAFLHGRFGIAYPVMDGPYINGYFQDIMPLPATPGEPSYGLLPFPPLPAVLLMPFVAVFGMATDAQLFGAVLGAINVGLAWRLTTRLTESRSAAFLATLFFAFGTVHWYAAIISTTWFLAHIVAVTFLMLGVTLALDAERREGLRRVMRLSAAEGSGQAGPLTPLVQTFEQKSLFVAWGRRLFGQIDGMQLMAGFVFGLAALSRLTIIFGAPFFLFIGGGGSYFKRALSAGIGAAIPIGLVGLYNFLSTGHLFNPVYEFLFQQQFHGLGYAPSEEFYGQREWGPENPLYIPLNAVIMFLWPPDIMPAADACTAVGRTLLGACPIAVPSKFGMSILLTSPAFLLIPFVAAKAWRQRVVLGSLLAVVAIAVVNLAHFSQGWVQFGYRFSLDFAPFALVLVTIGIAWLARKRSTFTWVAVPLVVLSILVNAWGVYWGVKLGW
ncbi:MAG TPA: hypothetical protein VM284_02195 [Candidatus Limnocylindria bacterium]|nr:hypothetical protein [Candidatus Limnocylindria bacterium]